MDEVKVEQLLKKIHDDGVLKAEKKAEEIIQKAEDKAKRIIEEAELKAKQINSFQERETTKVKSSLKEAVKLSLRDLKLKLKAEIISSFKTILNSKVDSILKNDDSQILKWVLESNIYEVKEGVTIESASCGLEEFKCFILTEFKDKIQTIDFELSDNVGFRLKLKENNVILDYSGDAITDYLIDLLGEDLKAIIRDTKEGSHELKLV